MWRAAASGAILALLALSGCLGDPEPRGSAREGGTASVALGALPTILDPAVAAESPMRSALWLAYTPPLTYRRAEGEEGTEVIPGVARELPEITEDGLTYSLFVRRGLRFSNGRQVRASDVRHTLFRAAVAGADGGLFDALASVRANDRTGAVEIRLTRPDPSFLHALAAVEAGVVPRGTPPPAAGRRPPPGVGPYRIARSLPRRGFTMRRDRDFRLPGVPAGFIDAVTAERPGAPADQARAVTGGRLDVMTETPPPELLPQLRSEFGERYSEHPALGSRYISVRAARGPLARRELRYALAYAIDRPEAARRLAGVGQPTCTLIPPILPGHEEPDRCPWGDPEEPADLERARELVAEADEGGTLVTVRATRAERPIARLVVETLRKIDLTPVVVRAGRADVTLATTRFAVPDPARLMAPFGVRVPLTTNPRAVLLADRLADAAEDDDADRLAAELDRELVRSAIVIPYARVSNTLFLSARMDAENCSRVHPVYGVDLSSLCVR
jgi:peptide/nickel transport system substrate-binding protein